ncbi:MAG: cell division protein FtsB [Lentimonas sp.]|jgi:cell division protein FtsB
MGKFKITKQIFISASIALALVIYFFYYTVFGEKGVIKYFSLQKELQHKNQTMGSLQNKMQNKQNMVDGMNSQSLDLDLLDEESRKNLGYAKKNEIVIYNQKSQ